MQQLDMPGARIAYNDDGEGEAVLLLHGSFSSEWFAPVAARLDGHRVIRVQRVGYGQSEDLAGGSGVAAEAGHYAEVLRKAGVERAHVVGHSSGASIALQLAHAHPELVGSLVLFEAAFPFAPDEPEGSTPVHAMTVARRGDYEQAADLFLSGVCGPDYREIFLRELGEQALRTAMDSGRHFFTVEAPGFAAWPFGPDEMATISAPTLLVIGGDRARPNTPHPTRSAHIAKYVPNSETQVLTELGHAMPLEDPGLTARTITGFTDRHPL